MANSVFAFSQCYFAAYLLLHCYNHCFLHQRKNYLPHRFEHPFLSYSNLERWHPQMKRGCHAAPPPIARHGAIPTYSLPTIVRPLLEVSGLQKVLPTLASIRWWRFSASLPILSTYKTIVNEWLGGMSSQFAQAIIILSLMVGPLHTLVIEYFSLLIGSVTTTNEVPLLRTLSLLTGTRVQPFFHSVRDRDRRCVLTGIPAVINGVCWWDTFEVAHVFPLAYEEYWSNCNFSSWITVPPASESHGTINSVQNGMLLTRDMHALFASYQISINPDVCLASP